MSNTTPTLNWQSRLAKVLTADPKKSIALAVLLVVLAVMIFRTVFGAGSLQPAAAVAAVKNALTGSSPAAGATPKPVVSTENPYAAAIQKWSEGPVPPVSRNLFTVRSEYFPVDGSRTTKSSGAEEGFWARLEKSITSKADQKDKRENLVANYRAQASQLRLQSTMMGPEPRAMINGELLGEGSVVAGFRVISIEARRVIVEREGIRLEIQMK